MTKSYPEFVQQFVKVLMQVMTEVEEDSDWLKAEVIQDDEDDSIAVMAEGSLDRIARALGELYYSAARALPADLFRAQARTCSLHSSRPSPPSISPSLGRVVMLLCPPSLLSQRDAPTPSSTNCITLSSEYDVSREP